MKQLSNVNINWKIRIDMVENATSVFLICSKEQSKKVEKVLGKGMYRRKNLMQ